MFRKASLVMFAVGAGIFALAAIAVTLAPALALFAGPLLIVGFLFLMLGVVVRVASSKNERTLAMRQLAENRGLNFQVAISAYELSPSIGLFCREQLGSCLNVVGVEVHGIAGLIFDYQYVLSAVDSGDHSSRRRINRTVAFFPTVLPRVPAFFLVRDSILSRGSGSSMAPRVDFSYVPDAQEFSYQFKVFTAEFPAVVQYLNKDRRKYLLSHPQCCVESDGRGLVLFMQWAGWTEIRREWRRSFVTPLERAREDVESLLEASQACLDRPT